MPVLEGSNLSLHYLTAEVIALVLLYRQESSWLLGGHSSNNIGFYCLLGGIVPQALSTIKKITSQNNGSLDTVSL